METQLMIKMLGVPLLSKASTINILKIYDLLIVQINKHTVSAPNQSHTTMYLVFSSSALSTISMALLERQLSCSGMVLWF